jgi:hypothetical protein
MNYRTVLMLVGAALGSACASTTTVDEFRSTTNLLQIADHEMVVILGRREAGSYETDRSFIECLGDEIDDAHFGVMSEDAFIDAFYPWFEPRTAPKSLARVQKLMERPFVRDRIAETGVRYLVWLDGEIETSGHAGSMSCAIGPAGGGCLGFSSWDKTAFFEAVVWDLANLTEEARIRVDSEGTSYIIGVIAPIPLLSPVRSQACSGMGQQLKSYFTQMEN